MNYEQRAAVANMREILTVDGATIANPRKEIDTWDGLVSWIGSVMLNAQTIGQVGYSEPLGSTDNEIDPLTTFQIIKEGQ